MRLVALAAALAAVFPAMAFAGAGPAGASEAFDGVLYAGGDESDFEPGATDEAWFISAPNAVWRPVAKMVADWRADTGDDTPPILYIAVEGDVADCADDCEGEDRRLNVTRVKTVRFAHRWETDRCADSAHFKAETASE